MLSPKMQRSVRINESQLLMLAEKARYGEHLFGPLYKRTSDNSKWQLRWFNLYQNLLFYYESESSSRPSGVILLEGCYCERLIAATAKPKETEPKYCFSITYRRENQRQYDLRANSEMDCKSWMDAIRQASFNKLMLAKEELEHKHLHLLQIVESEKTAKWQYTQQCEELTTEIKKLRNELCTLKKDWRFLPNQQSEEGEDSDEIRKIKKVQSFFRGWLCRRRWKQIVEEYIKSPHAESMRKRNSLVFRMVEAEEEYVEQLNILVTGFLRPFKMAASSKMPPCSHEDVNTIFLNSETLLFLHQIFLKGLSARMESWPTLVLGDLFDMLLPMLSIYQEYVRNHYCSLKVLSECKQNQQFSTFLGRLEAKSTCQGRTLETFLTYPMHQIPRYIVTLHELLSHTPQNHVERRSLDEARRQLEQLSRQMQDEQVSEAESMLRRLAVERLMSHGCGLLHELAQSAQAAQPAARTQRSRSISDSGAGSVTLSPSPSITNQSRSLSCFHLETRKVCSSFPRVSIDFPRDKKELFLSEDSDDPWNKAAGARRERSHSTVSCQPSQEIAAALQRHRHSCQIFGRGDDEDIQRIKSLRKCSVGPYLAVPSVMISDAAVPPGPSSSPSLRSSISSQPRTPRGRRSITFLDAVASQPL
ncbi:ras-specific guanine nucleotide-releasing factor 1-like isoform X3 [Amphibalanus amphitrite]|uniref:ras-specific guanine nucleotide-releasing factor 1-like isoform X3 n=2 Tax=Amphibalanus amphitrite TaxID=1232801 RepID=UPI001C8FB30B|nr:ras-specific guanine nucleotide-releasing factor 1-like isoform X3 [Amphibalanus amphitrite]